LVWRNVSSPSVMSYPNFERNKHVPIEVGFCANIRYYLAGFEPAPGAPGFQMSGPSIIDITVLTAALSVFDQTDMRTIVRSSHSLTGYLVALLDHFEHTTLRLGKIGRLWTIITPKDRTQRGAMLSLKWHSPFMLQRVTERLKAVGVIVDFRGRTLCVSRLRPCTTHMKWFGGLSRNSRIPLSWRRSSM
jgi:kynureninase